jgi:hypothetical protein
MKAVCLPILLITVVAATAALLGRTRTPPSAAPVTWSMVDDTAQRDDLAARSRARDAVCRELLAQRINLPEAAALFGWLDQLPPEVDPALLQFNQLKSDLPVSTREEWLCVRAAESAKGVARCDSPERAAELRARLDEELRRVWESGATKVLPVVNEWGCRLLHERSLAAGEVLSTGSLSPVLASDLPLIARR